MKYASILLWAILFPYLAGAQGKADSLRRMLQAANDDSARYTAYWGLTNYFLGKNNDSGFYYLDKRIELARKAGKKIPEIISLQDKGNLFLQLERYPEAFTCLQEALTKATDPLAEGSYWYLPGQLSPGEFMSRKRASLYVDLGMLFGFVQNPDQQLLYYTQARKLFRELGQQKELQQVNLSFSRLYVDKGDLDSALYYANIVEAQPDGGKGPWKPGGLYYTLGLIYWLKNQPGAARNYFYKGVSLSAGIGDKRALTANYYGLCRLFLEQNNRDSALFYARAMFREIQPLGVLALFRLSRGTACEMMGRAYDLNGFKDSAAFYLQQAIRINDSLFSQERRHMNGFQNLNMREVLRVQKMEQEKREFRNRIEVTFLIGGLAVLLLVAILVYRGYRLQRRAKRSVESAFKELKDTQSQLVQREKMASLGELTAGIAHEIQNPLNFVNNFSEVNLELIEELKNQKSKVKSERNDTLEEELLNDLAANEEKINHHGKRADAIVKGMLQHSRSSTGQNEPTDINALCDEYVRLAYHGLRAKDKNFNATLKTDFDESIGKINIIPQDIGRVVLNLINNAFYACTERLTQANAEKNRNAVAEREGLTASSLPLAASPYVPTVSLTTKKSGNTIEIRVADNGNGIPQKVLDKIFQPFFTTKPTGQGTGLGLSLSYDIVKAHRGEIKVETKEVRPDDPVGQGDSTVFTIQIPAF